MLFLFSDYKLRLNQETFRKSWYCTYFIINVQYKQMQLLEKDELQIEFDRNNTRCLHEVTNDKTPNAEIILGFKLEDVFGFVVKQNDAIHRLKFKKNI